MRGDRDAPLAAVGATADDDNLTFEEYQRMTEEEVAAWIKRHRR
jgi:hypothetical protein